MSCISWNCCGLGNPRTIRALHFLVKTKCPQVLFFMETKQDAVVVDGIRRKLGYPNCFTVPRVGIEGGLVLLWDDTLDLVVKSFSNSHVDAIIQGDVSTGPWRFIGFYGHPEACQRWESWELLRLLGRQNSLPWLCCRDFNEIFRGSETIGGRNRPE